MRRRKIRSITGGCEADGTREQYENMAVWTFF